MSYIKKYSPGKRICSTKEAVNLILNKKFIFYRHKPLHHGWTSSWSLISIQRFVSQGHLYRTKEK